MRLVPREHPAISGPDASPPMFAIVPTISARRVGTPVGPESRSVMNAVAVATTAPTATPVSTRAVSRPASDSRPRTPRLRRWPPRSLAAAPAGGRTSLRRARRVRGSPRFRGHRVDEGDGDRRQMLLLLIEPVEAARSRRERGGREERQRDRPEPRTGAEARAPGRQPPLRKARTWSANCSGYWSRNP
jgi:hypothetical protein